jgi:hypothetical protein
MCGNPFKLHDEVDGEFEVEMATATIYHKIPNLEIKWRLDQDIEVLTLDEIYEQVAKAMPVPITPYVEVRYESGLWGVIFQVGNYLEKGKTWIVHGITKGYA